LTADTVAVIFVTDANGTVNLGKKKSPIKERSQTMRCNNNNNQPKVNKLVFTTIAGTIAIPLIAALFLPVIYIPLVGLIIPFLAAAFLEGKVEALGCGAAA
jgi:hypothetical protein